MPGKSIPISKTKIIVPHRRPELLSRPRLLEHLEALLDNKLLLLSAPAGYGKTSLLIDLTHHVAMPVCWLALDLLDRDPQRFIAYLIASLAERFPGIGEASRPQLNRLKSIEEDAEALLVTLTNEIYDHVEEDFLLIIDDYHLLDDVPVISDLLNRFLELVVENCHVLLSSRTLPSLDDVTLMVAREQVAGISHAELAFVPREVQALYAQNYHQHLSDETANEFVEQTGGWITGMVLSNLPGMPRISGVDTFAYLGQQVLSQQPDHVREFLIRSSLPEEFNAEFCEIVLGPLYSEPQNWYDYMGLILEKNLFVLPLGEDGRWLRYHPLFRDFLQARLREQRPHEVQPMLERMVTAYERAGEWEKAYFTCKQLNDPEALAGVIERGGTPVLQSALVTLEGWINSLPPGLVRSRHGLISLRGMMAAMKGNLQEASHLLDTVVPLYRKERDVAGLTLALTRRAHTLRLLGKYSDSIKDIEEALQLAETDPALQPLYAEALRLKGLNLYRLGESRNAVEELEHSLSLYTELKEMGSIPMLLNETAMVYGAVGDVDSAKTSFEKALSIWREEKNLYYQAEILNNLGVLYHQIGEYELAAETYEHGLVCARKSRHQRAECLILTGLGDLYSEVEEFDSALQAYQQAEVLSGELGESFISNYLPIVKGILALLKHDLNSAGQIQNTYKRKVKMSQSMYEHGLWAFFEGRYDLLKGEYKKAVRLLQECKDFFIQDGRDLELQWSKIWLAAAYDKAGQRNHARNEIKELITGANPEHALLAAFRQAESWLSSLQNDGQIGRQLGGFLEKSRRLSMKLPSIRRALRRHAQSIQMPAASLIIRAFGRPEVIVNGRIIAMSDWRTQSVRDLFFYFLHMQEAVTKEQVAEALWPEIEDPQALKARFKNEIYRLRRAAGKNVIVFDEEYYLFNRALDYEYDVEAFDSHLNRARKARDKKEHIQHLQKAVDLVRAPYLADVDAGWAAEERERLGQAYDSALKALAGLYLDANQIQQCLSVCQLALERNRFHEVIYQLEMRAYAALGDRASIARRYQACKAVLEEELGIPPSEETELLYRELTGSGPLEG
ncbi:MAG TPA: tetratricopeptide repeat protein [Anaerolineales bacterium]|nr:tetratricopeptide repeat protein [Anaerolineales bacterium]